MTTLERPGISRDDSDPTEFIRELSNQTIVAAPPSGPVFADGTCAVHRINRPETFVPALPRRTRVGIALFSVGWIATYAIFWIWWFRPEHLNGHLPFVVNTLLLAWVSSPPLYFLVTANRLRRVSPKMEIPRLRVAIVVTKAPSEPWPVVQQTLEAMLRQTFPYSYDVWLCDEDPSPETLTWCSRNGVRVSTRRGVAAYQRDVWPRRKRCKEGNLAYFYDHYGYCDYDVVSQLDCDHVPEPTYLAEMIRPFGDSSVGYVAAPSVCAKNRSSSWAVRGRLFYEAKFHGAHQLGHNGHNDDLGPICIGSHYAVRTQALASIGGIGPELAEDFSTSYLMNVNGWSGAFAIEAHAQGDGPIDFPAMVTQEFQWARSLAVIMLGLVPRTLRRVPAVHRAKRFRFAFALSWYPMLAGTFLAGLLLAAAGAVLDIQWVRINYFEFLALTAAMTCWMLAIYGLLRRHNLLRPNDAPVWSWEVALYLLSRWVYIGWGVVAALAQRVAPRPLELKVTPKHGKTAYPLPLRTVLPFIAIVVGLSVAALVGMARGGPVGYIFLCLLNASIYAAVSLAIPLLHAAEAVEPGPGRIARCMPLTAKTLPATLLAVAPLAVALIWYPSYFIQAFGW